MRHLIGSNLAITGVTPWILVSVLVAAGCHRSPSNVSDRHRVAGTVLVDGKPLEVPANVFGKVWLHPDTSKGNSGGAAVTAGIDQQGRYEVSADTGGLPAGWYRVTVVIAEKVDPNGSRAKRKSLIAAKYGRPETSGLAVEVVANAAPGAYDLHLKR